MSRNLCGFCFLMSMVVMSFSLAMPAQAQAGSFASSPDLTCGPAPCVFPNMQVSSGGQPFLTNVLAADPADSGAMLIGAEDYNCNSRLGIFHSEDTGVTWTHACFPLRSNGEAGGSPIAAYDLNGVAYVGGLQAPTQYHATELLLRASKDNGKTWEAPAIILDNAGSPWLEIDTNTASPFRNTLYVSSTRYSQVGNTYLYNISVSSSADGGKTWKTRTVASTRNPNASVMSHLATGPDGTAYVSWLSCKRRGSELPGCGGSVANLWISQSSDGGDSWSLPTQVAQTRLPPDAVTYTIYGALPGTLVPVTNIPVVAVDNSSQPTSGNVYVAFYNYNGSQMQVGVVTSKDHGSTWSAPVRVSPSIRGDEFFQWISVASDGTLGATWLDRSADYFDYQPAYAVSKDGGITFSDPAPLSNWKSDPNLVWPGGEEFMGEHRTHVWVGNAIYAAWLDTRSGHGEIELGGVQF